MSPMSKQETVEVVRRAYAAFNRQDYQGWLRDFVDRIDIFETAQALKAACLRG